MKGPPLPFLVAGLLAVVFYAARGVALELRGELPHILWSCHVGCLLSGVAILAGNARALGVGLLFTAAGLPFWVLDLAIRQDFQVTSMLTHVGGLAIAVLGARRLGVPRGTWWRATAGIVLLHLASRLITPAAENVNLSNGYWFGWEGEYVSYPVYLAIMLAFTATAFAAVEFGARALIRR